MTSTCPNCGGPLLGDGYTVVLHCEFAEIRDQEPDADPIYCAPAKFQMIEFEAEGL